MNFHEAIASDIINVFLQENEFAREIEYNDTKILAIVEESSESITGSSKNDFDNASALGLFSHDTVLYIRKDDIENKPVPSEEVYIDGFLYTVSEASNAVSEQEGMYIILLSKVYS